jgi:dimethylamine monooxygenase subunit A
MRKDLAMASSSFVYPPPTDGKPFRLVMGLRNMPPAEWIEVGPELPAQQTERRELIETRRDTVFAAQPGFDSPVTHFAELILENLKQFHASSFQVENMIIRDLATGFQVDLTDDHPFLQLAKIIGEDLCLISKVENEWVLTAGAVVYPSRWLLAEKLGKTLDQIHQPVPGYEQSLQPAMALSFDKLNPERQVWRLNWALHSRPILHQPTAVHESAAPAEYWWRTERQTLTKLPDANHVLFTIRNRVEPLSQLLQRPSEAAAFAQTLNTMSNETIAYKGLTQDHKAMVDYLMSRNPS